MGVFVCNYTTIPIETLLHRWVGLVQGNALDPLGSVFDPAGLFLANPVPRPAAFEVYSHQSELPTGDFIALIDLSSRLSLLRQLARSSVHTTPRNRPFVSAIERELGPLMFTKELSFIGVQDSCPGLIGTTIDPIRNIFIGMHIDSWDHSKIASRLRARNRISINLGSEERTLLFSPINIARMASEELHGPFHPSSLTRHYFKRRMRSAVYSLTVPPGFAYIFPTEYLPHDASTASKNASDVSATLLGYLTPRSAPQHSQRIHLTH